MDSTSTSTLASINTQFRVIIAGSRGFTDYPKLKAFCDNLLKIKSSTHSITIVSGGAQGADKLGEKYAKENNYGLDVYKADWNTYGKSAGYKRNQQMSLHADVLIAAWDSKSRGTMHMINIMNTANKPVRILHFKQP